MSFSTEISIQIPTYLIFHKHKSMCNAYSINLPGTERAQDDSMAGQLALLLWASHHGFCINTYCNVACKIWENTEENWIVSIIKFILMQPQKGVIQNFLQGFDGKSDI